MTRIVKLLPCLMLAACASPADMRGFGELSRAAFARQVIAPSTQAAASAAIVGIDGAAALQAQLAYRKSYAEPAPPAAPLVVSFGARP